MKGIDVPILEDSDDPENDVLWTSVFGNKLHPDFQEPVFFRHNMSSVNLMGSFRGETCFLIGRGPSITNYIDDKECFELLNNPSVVKYCMNTSLELFGKNP